MNYDTQTRHSKISPVGKLLQVVLCEKLFGMHFASVGDSLGMHFTSVGAILGCILLVRETVLGRILLVCEIVLGCILLVWGHLGMHESDSNLELHLV